MGRQDEGSVSVRSSERVTRKHLTRLAALARADREAQFARGRSWAPYQDRLLCVALCQGAALHYVDGANGVKDLDVWTFFAELPRRRTPDPGLYRRRGVVDFGPSSLGRHPDFADFHGRRVDLLARALPASPGDDPASALRAWLSEGRSTSARLLRKKAAVLIEPDPGTIVWPVR